MTDKSNPGSSRKAPAGDEEPFQSTIYSLIRGDPDGHDLPELELKINDRDMVLCVEDDVDHVRVLYLQNVREDTLAPAKTAVDSFLDQMKPPSGSSPPGNTAYLMFDKVYKEIDTPLRELMEHVSDFQEDMVGVEYAEYSHPKRPATAALKDHGQDFNPALELLDLCSDFIIRAREIKDKSEIYRHETCPKTKGSILARKRDHAGHSVLTSYIIEQVRQRGHAFDAGYNDYKQLSLGWQWIFRVQSAGGRSWQYEVSARRG